MKGLDLKKKMGPLPVWAWGLIIGIAGYYVYTRYRSSSSTTGSSTPTDSVLDPNAIDPNTGLTYGQEEDAALNANAAQLGGGSSTGTVPTDNGTGDINTGTSELGDLESFLTLFGGLAQELGYTPPGALAPVPPPITSSTPKVRASTSGQHHNGTVKHPLVGKGAVRAKSGPRKPPAKKGYTIKGLGGGAWEYVPTKKPPAGRHKPPRPAQTKPKPKPKPKQHDRHQPKKIHH